MPRRLLRVAIVGIVLAATIAGCAGIPTSGGVNAGGAISDKGNAPGPADLPLPPRNGESRAEILSDFMGAATSPDNDYSIAKQFLTATAAQKWNPDKSVLIRQGPSNMQPQLDGSIDYPVTTKASVDSTGVYSQQSTSSTQILKFGFRKVNKQWRISALADGTVISATSFPQVFSAQALYFFDPSYQFLVPDLRWFPVGSSQPNSIVNALLGGPTTWLQGGTVATAFPQNVQLVAPVQIKSGTVDVDMSLPAQATKPIDRVRMQQQIQESLRNSNVTNVSMSVRGAPLAVSDSVTSAATTALAIDPSALVGDGKKFGFAPRLQPIGHISSQVISLGATAVTLDRNQTKAAALSGCCAYLISNASAKPLQVDSRAGLIAPSIDPFGYVWSVPSAQAAAIQATASDGLPHAITSTISPQARIVALAVSHDGTRVLLYMQTSAGPILDVAGVLRHGTDNAPIGLGPLLQLAVSSSTPVDATWIDDRSVAVLSRSGGTDTVTTLAIGGLVGGSNPVDDAISLAGGTSEDTLRVLTTGGQVQQLRSSGWQNTGTSATLLGTQQ
jgi:hypothetical protein